MWYLATNEVDVFHYGELIEGATVTTGQPKLDYFETKENLIAALESYGQKYSEPETEEMDIPPMPNEN